MRRVFSARGYFVCPDGTEVSPFLNATDSHQPELPWGALGAVSIAAGRVSPGSHSAVHVHPAVTQVTYLMAGALSVRMREPAEVAHYDLALAPGQAVVSQPGTLFQLRNDGDAAAEILYVVSPSYVFEVADGKVQHDDAIVVAATWEALDAGGELPGLRISAYEARARREEALRRMAARRGLAPPELEREPIQPLKRDYDYLAPDGSEIRLLVGGEHGGLAHCVLPAGRSSAPVQHRTVEELWYVLEGKGVVWRQRDGEPAREDPVQAGDSLRIPVGVAFQFRAAEGAPLKLLLATMPPWPGPEEAVPARGGMRDNG